MGIDIKLKKREKSLEYKKEMIWEKKEGPAEKKKSKDKAARAEFTELPSQQIEFPNIKEIELLKEGVYAVDLEKTINDMLMVIKNMESQLNSVLNINATLERDLKDSKEIVAGLKKERGELESRLLKLEEEIPSKRELQIEIDYQIEERNKAELLIRELRAQLDNVSEKQVQNLRRRSSLEDQKQDYIIEINYLESQLHTATETLRHYEKEINLLNGEKLALTEKMKNIQQEFKENVEEKYQLINDLKASRMAVDELHNALTETRRQVTMSFYKGEEQSPVVDDDAKEQNNATTDDVNPDESL